MTDDKTRRAILQLCRSWHDAGVEHLPKVKAVTPANLSVEVEQPPAPEPTPTPAATPKPAAPPPQACPAPQRQLFDEPGSGGWINPVLTLEDRESQMETLRGEVSRCLRCEELACSRTQTVFGVGKLQPRLCFFGEAPGADEDRQGEPFVGKAGQLLDKIIAACTLRREEVYILNVLKCRPPGNRTPVLEEVTNCRPFFERQLEILQPQYICCLGAAAAQALLQTTLSVGKLRKQFHPYRGAKVIVTYHPAYLLRNPAAKRDVWEDMKMLMKEMGIELAK